jgi:hypothetical protein
MELGSQPMKSQFKTLAELASITPGFSPKPDERRKTGRYLLLGGRNIKDGKLVTTSADAYVDEIDRESFRRAMAHPGDIIVSTLFDRRKLYQYAENDPPAVVNSSCAIIRAGRESDYIASYLRTIAGQKDFLDKATQATGGAFIPRLSVKSLASIQIPIIPVAELAQLSDVGIGSASDNELLAIKADLLSNLQELTEQNKPLTPVDVLMNLKSTREPLGGGLFSRERPTDKGLLAMKADLAQKDDEIARLRDENQRLEEFYMDRIRAISEQIEVNTLASRIKHGETATLEFKSSLRWNIKTQKNDPNIENAVLKTIAAFCNTNGGELLIGVADDKSILGIDHDGFPNDDRFQLHLRNILVERLIPSVADLVRYEMVSIDGKKICHVTCNQSKKRGIWLRNNNAGPERFYVRVGPSSTELAPPEAVEYIIGHLHEGA